MNQQERQFLDTGITQYGAIQRTIRAYDAQLQQLLSDVLLKHRGTNLLFSKVEQRIANNYRTGEEWYTSAIARGKRKGGHTFGVEIGVWWYPSPARVAGNDVIFYSKFTKGTPKATLKFSYDKKLARVISYRSEGTCLGLIPDLKTRKIEADLKLLLDELVRHA